jgi:hypothetical protein
MAAQCYQESPRFAYFAFEMSKGGFPALSEREQTLFRRPERCIYLPFDEFSELAVDPFLFLKT